MQFFKPDIFIVSAVEEILRKEAGSNSKGVLVIAQMAEGVDMEQEDLLNKILLSVQLNGKEDVLLLKTLPSMRFSLASLCRSAGCHTALIFGAEPEQLGLHFRIEKYKPFAINHIRGVWADTPAELSPSRDLKAALWSSLKQLFPTT